MTLHDPSTRGAAAAPTDSGTADARRDSAAVHFLAGRGDAARAESRRILVGFSALFLAALVAINVGLWRSAVERLEEDGWDRLSASTDARRRQIQDALGAFRREALSIAHDADIAAASVEVADGRATAEERQALASQLAERVTDFQLDGITLEIPGRGTPLAAGEPPGDPVDSTLVREAAASGEARLGDLVHHHLLLAAPVAPERGADSPVLVFRADAERVLTPLLREWPGFGVGSGAYLVRAEGDRVVVLTDLSHASSLREGSSVPMSDPAAFAASMAASGVESRAEVLDAEGRPAWAVTRVLGETGWGMVGQVDREAMLAGLQTTRQSLMLLDLALLGCLAGMVWLWRRFYSTGLARREREVTERHARRVQSMLDTAFDAILTFDERGLVRSANRAAEALFGRVATELEGQPIARVLHWPDGRRLPAPGPVGAGEALRADGTRIPVETSVGRTDESGEALFTAIVRDIRERVEAENRIKAFAEGLEISNRRLEEMNAQLEEASRLKSEFLANTSHELRTPLNGMIGFLQLVLDGLCDGPDEERDFLRQALQCSRHLLGLINDVLDIAKIEAGKLALEIDRLDVQQIFDEVRTVTHVQAAQKGVELLFEPRLEEGVRARGDFGKVKQVLINLVGNSLKFTSKGRILVRATSRSALGHIMFEVIDTGIGIPLERQQMIFEKFVQADGSTTRRFGGTGLGLAITKSLVELMGGIIGVTSEGEGLGTRMYFSLPVWRDESPALPEAPAPAGDQVQGASGGPLVLVVEDDPVFRRFLAAVLQQGGYRTVEADHAESGWMLARRLRPAVIVLDYALSCGDNATLRTGWDLAERMTHEAETRHIPVVFVTGFDGELKQKLQATAFARRPEHLVKPIDAKVLVEKVAQLAGEVHGRQVRVLMADDDPTVTAYVRKVLPRDRYHVEVANDGEECLHILRTQPNGFDVLLLDLMMPEVSGYDVLREMTLAGVRPDLPVLVLTNFPEARNDEERRLLEQGLVLDVVAKTAVHDNPQMLPHVLDWHLQRALEEREGGDAGAAREAA